MKRLIEKSYKVVLVLLFILLLYASYYSIFDIYQAGEELKPLVLIIGTIVLIFAFVNIKKIVKKVPEKKSNIVAIILCILFFVAMLIFGSLVTSIPTYDLSNIQREASLMLDNNGKFVSEGYFSVYSNQVSLAILVYYIYKIGSFFNIENLKVFGMIINCLCISLTAFFSYATVKKLENHELGLVTLLFFIINPMFYAYSSYFYSDTLSMIFAASSIYIFIVAMKSENIKTKIPLEIVSGIILALGFEIRVVLAILIIGIIISLFLKLNKKMLIDIISLITGFFIGIAIYYVIRIPFEPKINKNLEFPVTHWVMMGINANKDGRWNAEDYQYTEKFKTYDEKVDNNIEEIKRRFSELKYAKLFEFLGKKIAVNWSNGCYDYNAKLINSDNINSIYEYVCGNKKIFFTYYCQICKITVLIIFMTLVIKELKSSENKYSFLTISVFGAFIFYLIWEVLTRYSLSFLPWMILGFGIGITEFEKILDIKKVEINIDNTRKRVININKTINVLSVSILILSVCMVIVNYYDYTIKPTLKWDKVAMQWDSVGNLNLKISNNNIRQTFIAEKTFNCISIKFRKQNVKNNTHYKFCLKDNEGGGLIYPILYE